LFIEAAIALVKARLNKAQIVYLSECGIPPGRTAAFEAASMACAVHFVIDGRLRRRSFDCRIKDILTSNKWDSHYSY